MRNNILISVFTFVFVIGITSCDDFLGGDFNDNPNKVTEVLLSAMLPVAIESTADLHYKIAFVTSQVSQQMYSDNLDESRHASFTLSSSWTEAYLISMNNLDQIIAQSQDEGVPHYEGIAQVLMAFNLAVVTDTWEDVPYTDAFSGFASPKPSYDSQESIYSTIDDLLISALSNLATANVEGLEPGSDDMIYGGAIPKWIMMANALKVRVAIHLTNKGDKVAADKVLATISSAFASSNDDFELMYNSVNKNPWHTTPVLADVTGNFTIRPGAYFIDNLNGVNFPFASLTEDPRLEVLTFVDTTITDFATGGTLDGKNGGNTSLSKETYHTTESAPITMISYAEMKFIQAEAHMIKGDKNAAYDAYLDGIKVAMDKVGAGGTDYLKDASVAVGSSALTMALIMKEKYIALFLNPETWVDMRRHGYSTTIYPNILPPPPATQIVDELSLGEYPYRALYPMEEYNRNKDNVSAVTKKFGDKMWRDKQ